MILGYPVLVWQFSLFRQDPFYLKNLSYYHLHYLMLIYCNYQYIKFSIKNGE